MLSRLYGRTDLFTLPSLHEGYGMAFAEAIVRGVPVVGARAGAVPEVVPPQAGVLTRPEVRALARALRPLLESSRRRARLAWAAPICNAAGFRTGPGRCAPSRPHFSLWGDDGVLRGVAVAARGR